MVKSIMYQKLEKEFKANKNTSKTPKIEDYEDENQYSLPDTIKFPRKINKNDYNGMYVYEIPPEEENDKIIIYVHGGGFLSNFSNKHWGFLKDLCEELDCGIVAPDYFLIPKYDVSQSNEKMMLFYEEFIKTHQKNKIILMGDSAGAGFALSMTQQARDLNLDLPNQLILISPWVDVTGGDESLEEQDMMLSINELLLFGENWAGDLDVKDPLVSPLFGTFENLPETYIFTGKEDLLTIESEILYEKMEEANCDVNLIEKEEMGHGYPLFPCDEAFEARSQICKIIRKGDKIYSDSDGDGKIDTVAIDTDGDGIIDYVEIDTDGDGKADFVAIDTDFNGKFDTYGFDTDKDGKIDKIGYDYDEDGTIDHYEDVNE